MSWEGSMNTPNPGSQEAVDAGCKCPVMDNWRGDPAMGRIRGFVVTVGCPVHHPANPGAERAPKKESAA